MVIVAILLVAIAGYSINGYCGYFINVYFVTILLMVIGGYFINGS
jgi:hypothetical protein